MPPTLKLVFGSFLVLYGIVTIALRFIAPDSRVFSKLEPMRARWGHNGGTALHWLGYSIGPIVMGILMILRGLG